MACETGRSLTGVGDTGVDVRAGTGVFPIRSGFGSGGFAPWRLSGRRARCRDCRTCSGDRGVRSGEDSRVIRRYRRRMRWQRLRSGFRCDRCRRDGSPAPPAHRKVGRRAAGPALGGASSDVSTRAGGSGRNAAVYPPVASLCLADRGVGFAARRAGSMRGCHPLASATGGGSSRPRLVRRRDRVCSVPCFGRRQRHGRSAPIRRRQRRRQGVCRSSERNAPAFAALSR